MRVVVWPSDSSGACGANRALWPAQAAADAGLDVVVDWIGPQVAWSKPWAGDLPPADVDAVGVRPPDADVVVLQRQTRRWWPQIIPMLQAHGVRVVFDIDDDFAHIPGDNPAHRAFDPRRNLIANRDVIRACCHLADLVTVTTPALAARYGRHGRVRVLPNMIPASYLNIPHRDMPVLGWTGNVQTHPDDLETTGRTVGPVLDRHGWSFRTIGTGQGVPERLGLDRTDASGWVPISRYPVEYARLGAAIVPLHPGPFNEAKSALKMAEAAALGVPVVASPTADNQRLHALGVGLLAKRPHDWARQLDRLLGSAGLRADMSGRGREAMSQLTYESNGHLWADAWTSTTAAHVAA